MNLSKNVKLTRVSNAVAAGTTEVDSSVIDMQGFEGVAFTVAFGAIVAGAATTVKLQHGDAANLSDAADLAGTGITVADTDDNTLVIAEIFQPTKRYVRCVVTRATQNSTVDAIIAAQYQPKVKPVTQDATTVTHVGLTLSPAAGTP